MENRVGIFSIIETSIGQDNRKEMEAGASQQWDR
jgi:hypothetical protein